MTATTIKTTILHVHQRFWYFFTATGQLRREISIRRTVGYGGRLITDLDTHDEFFFFFVNLATVARIQLPKIHRHNLRELLAFEKLSEI